VIELPRRCAWVLSGLHTPPPAGTEPGPRSEFQVLLERFGGDLLSLTSLDHPAPPLAGVLTRAG
jgi:hypothetical protein